MQIFGSSQNIALFRKSILQAFEGAGLHYMKAFRDLEVYLGTVFSEEALAAKDNQIFEMEMENYYELYGERAVAAGLNLYFWRKLGRFIQKKYLPLESDKWEEFAKIYQRKLDFNEYYYAPGTEIYIPALELVGQIFRHAVAGDKEMITVQMGQAKSKHVEELDRELLVPCVVYKRALEINYHVWRRWFYSLWGQNYEWGCFQINQRTAEANGNYYYFNLPPQRIGKISLVPAKEILEAHDYRVSISNDGRMEYWR